MVKKSLAQTWTGLTALNPRTRTQALLREVSLKKPQIRHIVWIYLVAFALVAFSFHAEAKKKEKLSDDTVIMDTSMGKIEIKLNLKKAPISSENFLKYVDSKHYDGTIYHRVIDGFMIQGGGFTADLKEKSTREPIKNEAGNGLSNKTGTIAMARTNIVDSATSQFFINVKDNTQLDHTSEDPRGFGYAVFGEVTSGMDVVNKIKGVATGDRQIEGQSEPFQNVPKETITIKSVRRKPL